MGQFFTVPPSRLLWAGVEKKERNKVRHATRKFDLNINALDSSIGRAAQLEKGPRYESRLKPVYVLSSTFFRK